jgi:hypothetical protein
MRDSVLNNIEKQDIAPPINAAKASTKTKVSTPSCSNNESNLRPETRYCGSWLVQLTGPRDDRGIETRPADHPTAAPRGSQATLQTTTGQAAEVLPGFAFGHWNPVPEDNQFTKNRLARSSAEQPTTTPAGCRDGSGRRRSPRRCWTTNTHASTSSASTRRSRQRKPNPPGTHHGNSSTNQSMQATTSMPSTSSNRTNIMEELWRALLPFYLRERLC